MALLVDGSADMRLERDGAQLFPEAARGDLAALRAVLGRLPADHAGLRLNGIAALSPFLSAGGSIGSVAAGHLGRASRPVKAILFDKSPAMNWALGWHQDRTICVAERRDVPGFGPWTVKRGMHHVAPPPSLLAGMVTLRVHLDDVPETNAPLLVAPGSHRLGKLLEADIAGVVKACGIRACLADAGDVWLYSTPILHASDAATHPGRRRVLQVDYAAVDLPGGLQWLGV